MSLTKDSVSIPLLKGINTRVDPLQEQVGSLTVLKNAKFTKLGNISKRKGYNVVADQGTILSTYPPENEIKIRLADPLAVKGVGGLPVVITKSATFRYTKANKNLYRTGSYFPMNYTSFPLPADDFLQVNSQSVVYGDLAFHLHTKITQGDLVVYVSIYDISKGTPAVLKDQSALVLNMTGASFPNSVDGGDTYSAFSHTDAQTANGKIITFRDRLYIFVTDSSGNLFYKNCDPYDVGQVVRTSMADDFNDGGWIPVFGGNLSVIAGTSSKYTYDVIGHGEGIVLAMVKTVSTDNLHLYKWGRDWLEGLFGELYYTYGSAYGFTDAPDCLALQMVKKHSVTLPADDVNGDLLLSWAQDNVITVISLTDHYEQGYTWQKTLTAGIGGLPGVVEANRGARFISVVPNDNNFTAYGVLDPNTTNTASIYFDVFVSYRKTGNTGVGTADHIPFIDNTNSSWELRHLTVMDTAGGPDDFIREGDWSSVAWGDLEPWVVDYNVCWEFFPDTTSVSTPVADIAIEDYAYGSSIAGRAFQAKWGETDAANYTYQQIPWDRKTGRWIQPFAKESELQSAFYFLSVADYFNNSNAPQSINDAAGTGIKTDSEWVGILSYGIGGGDLERGTGGVPSLSNISYVNNGVLFPYTQQFRVISEDKDSQAAAFTAFYNTEAATLSKINYNRSVPNQSQEIADSLIIPGGIVTQYQHGYAQEAGFLQAPYRLYLYLGGIVSMVEVATATPVFAKGNVYNYVAVFSNRDLSGRVYKSGISKQLQVTITNTGVNTGYDALNLLVPFNTTTNADGSALQVEVYRTTNNGTVFYKVSGQDPSANYPFILNNIGQGPFSAFRDTITDDNLTDNELLYTTGGVLENTPAPACTIMEVYKNIIFMAGLENPYNIQYSKVVGYNTAVDFNDTLILETPTTGGPVSALKGMDDKLFIFKNTSIYFIAGGQNNFTSYLRTRAGGVTNMELPVLSSDIGCINKNSCVLTPIGIMFKSNRGIYLISRNMQLEYIGAPVQEYNNLVINDSCLYAKEGEVRFITERTDCIVYNYERDVWYTFSQHSGTSCSVIDEQYYYINDVDRLLVESDEYDDDGSSVPLVLETGWMSFAKVQGFQRVYRMLILGNYKSAHQLRVKIAYNYDDTWVDEQIVTITDPNVQSTTVPQADRFSAVDYGTPLEQTTGTSVSTSGQVDPNQERDGFYGDPSWTLDEIPGAAGNFEIAQASSYGEGVEGMDDLVGGSLGYAVNEGTQYQFRINLKKQKCESIKVSIETIQDTGETDEGATISNLSFLVGVKGGDFRIKQSRVKGTT